MLTLHSLTFVTHILFGLSGAILALRLAQFCLAKTVKPNAWIGSHIGSFIGSGIAAYTAFFAFGGRSLFAGLGVPQMLFWIAPGLIGGIAIARLSGKYQHGLATAKMVKTEIKTVEFH